MANTLVKEVDSKEFEAISNHIKSYYVTNDSSIEVDDRLLIKELNLGSCAEMQVTYKEELTNGDFIYAIIPFDYGVD